MKLSFSVNIALVLILSCVTYARNDTWSDSIKLWQDAVAKSPQKPRPHSYLGWSYGLQGRYRESAHELEIALKLDPYDYQGRNNLGATYIKLGRNEDALAQFKYAIMINPNYKYPYLNIGNIYLQMKRISEAISEYRIALEIDPQDEEIIDKLRKAQSFDLQK